MMCVRLIRDELCCLDFTINLAKSRVMLRGTSLQPKLYWPMSMFMGIVLIVYYSRVNTSDDMCAWSV